MNTLKTTKINIQDLKPAEYNPRIMQTEEQEKLKQGLTTFGLVDPIIIDLTDNNTVIGGHQRLEILKQLNPDTELLLIKLGDIGLVIKETDLKIKDKNDQKALNLALNKINGDWDYKKLDDLLLSLNEDNYNIELTGFDENDLLLNIDDSINLVNDEYNIELNIEDQEENNNENNTQENNYFSNEEIQNQIIQEYIPPQSLEEFISRMITPSVAMYQFNRLCNGYKDGTKISLLFNPHRLDTPVNKNKKSLYEGLKNDPRYTREFARYVSNYCKVVPPYQLCRYIGVGSAGYQQVNEFQPYIARIIYNRYSKNGDNILNPCAGWGGRLIGLASLQYNNIQYIETDTNPQTVQGLLKLKKFLKLDPKQYITHDKPFEKLKLNKNSFDLIFTSPPYFNTELYQGEQTSYKNKKNYTEWKEQWYIPFIDKCLNLVTKTGNIILNIDNKTYPLLSDLKEYLQKEYNLTTKQLDLKLNTPNLQNRGGTDGEPFILFNKQEL